MFVITNWTNQVATKESTLHMQTSFSLKTRGFFGTHGTHSNYAPEIIWFSQFSHSILIFGTLIYWHWEAMLISYLSYFHVALPFNSIPELVSKSNFRVATSPGSAYAEYFSKSDDEVLEIVWKDR